MSNKCSSAEKNTQQDWTGFAEHLRKTQLLLAALSLGILLALEVDSTPRIERALAQLTTVSQVMATWQDSIVAIVYDLAKARTGDESMVPAAEGEYIMVAKTGGRQECWDLSFSGTRFVIHDKKNDAVVSVHPSLNPQSISDYLYRIGMIERARRPNDGFITGGEGPSRDTEITLTQFGQFWDQLNNEFVVGVVEDVLVNELRVRGATRPFRPADFLIVKELPRTDVRTCSGRLEFNIAHILDDYWTCESQLSFDDEASPAHFNIPCRSQEFSFIPQGYLLSKIQERDAPTLSPGRFDQTFSDLHEAAEAYADLGVDKIKLILESERVRSGHDLKMVGFSIPRNELSFWGLGILLAVYAYFVAHLREIAGRINPGDEGTTVCWAAFSRNTFGRLIFLASGVALPIVAGLDATVRLDFARNWLLVGYGLSLQVAITICGAATLSSYRRIQRSLHS